MEKKERKEIEYYLIGGMMLTLIILSVLQIVFRFVLNFSLSWTEELSRYIFILMVYTGLGYGFKRGTHVRVEVVDLFLSPSVLKHLSTVNDIIVIIMLAVIAWFGLDIVINAYQVNQLSPAMGLPIFIVYSIIPVMFTVAIVRIIQTIYIRYFSKNQED